MQLHAAARRIRYMPYVSRDESNSACPARRLSTHCVALLVVAYV